MCTSSDLVKRRNDRPVGKDVMSFNHEDNSHIFRESWKTEAAFPPQEPSELLLAAVRTKSDRNRNKKKKSELEREV